MKPDASNRTDSPDAFQRWQRIYQQIQQVERFVGECSKPSTHGWIVRYSMAEADWSPEVFQMLGLEISDKVPPGVKAFRNVPQYDLRRIVEETRLAWQERRALDIRYQVRTRNGSPRILFTRSRPLVARSGNALGYVGIVTDVSAQIQTQLAISAVREELGRWFPSDEGMNHHAVQPASARDRPENPSRPGAALPAAKLRRVLAMIEERFLTGLGVDEMAAAIGLSGPHFVRAFKHATGETPHQYIMCRRLEKATADLARGADKIATVAVDCGFFDQAHLTRCFRKKFGITPGEAVRTFNVVPSRDV
jgi:AraC-like DNA-binding protein